jgi:hypothetical protein
MEPNWMLWVLIGLSLAGVLVQVALLLNVHKILGRVVAIRRELEDAGDDVTREHLAEAVAQLQGVAVSLDRIALRCDAIEKRVGEIAARPPGQGGGDAAPAVEAIRAGLAEIRGPVAEIRDLLGRSEVERIADEVRRCLYTRGFDTVTILTDLTTVPREGETNVQVEVIREGVKAKGFVVVRDGAAVESKVTPAYGMFP